MGDTKENCSEHREKDFYANYHKTCIESIHDFLIWIKNAYEAQEERIDGHALSFRQDLIYYRGQSRSSWELKPSVLRDILPSHSSLDEHRLLKKANLSLWKEVSSFSYLEKMIFFQHYGLSTRLLDVTFNPLVALYMACCDENEWSDDGAVYCGCYVNSENSKAANAIAEYVFNREYQRMVVDIADYAKKENVDIEEFTKPIFIVPPINNPRIEAQNGAFIMSPLLDAKGAKDVFLMSRAGLQQSDFFYKQKAIIKKDFKESILHELSILGVNNGSIYKGIEAKLKSIVMEEKYWSKIHSSIEV